MHVEEQMLGDFLVDRGLLSRRSIDDALKRAGGAPLYEALQGFGLVDEDELRRAAAHAMGVKFVEFAHHEIEQDALFLIPEPLARAHNILGLRVSELGLEVALLNLTDLEVLEPLRLRHRILPRLTSHRSLTRGLLHYQKLLKEKFAAILGRGGDTVEALLHHALLSRAHGVHIDLKTTGALVRYRIGHSLEDAMELPAHIGQALADKLKLLAKLLPASPERQRGEPASPERQRGEPASPERQRGEPALRAMQDGRFKFEVKGGPSTELGAGERHAVHVFAGPRADGLHDGKAGERITLRLARESQGYGGFTQESLGLHGRALEDIHRVIVGRPGLMVVAGPQGSGVTTLLYTFLDLLNAPSRVVATVEDAIEHRLPRVMQVEIDPAAGVDTATTLRAVLKTDPDIVMVANLKDSRAAALAASAASRGVLVLAGIEAGSAAEAIEKLRELGVQPLTLATTLRAVVATRVVGRVAADAARYFPTRAELSLFDTPASQDATAGVGLGRVLAALKEEGAVAEGTRWKELQFARGQAGEGHGNTAGSGQVGLQEVMPITEPIKELILRGIGVVEIEQEAKAEGMLSIIEDGLFKAAQGITSIEEVARLVRD